MLNKRPQKILCEADHLSPPSAELMTQECVNDLIFSAVKSIMNSYDWSRSFFSKSVDLLSTVMYSFKTLGLRILPVSTNLQNFSSLILVIYMM